MRAGMFTSRGLSGPDPSTPPPFPSFNVFPSFGHSAETFSPSQTAGKSDRTSFFSLSLLSYFFFDISSANIQEKLGWMGLRGRFFS